MTSFFDYQLTHKWSFRRRTVNKNVYNISLIYYNIFCNPQWSMTLKYGFESGARLRSSRTVQVRTFLKGLLRNSQEVAAELLLGPPHDQFILLSAARATMELLQMVLNVGI